MKSKYNLEKTKIINDLNNGLSVNDISKIYKCSKSLIWQFCKKNKIKIPEKDFVGFKFHNFEVIQKLGSRKNSIYWLCKCSCGNTRELPTKSITRKEQKSCGCYFNEYQYRSTRQNWNGYKDIPGKWWGILKRGAKTRNHEFDITIEYAWDLFEKQKMKCALSGVPIQFSNSSRNFVNQTASIDRIDNNKGYLNDNIQWVHKLVNFMKQDMDNIEFKKWCNLIVNNGIKNEI